MLYLIALLVVPYVCFVFFGEGFNPFSKPKNPSQRARWRHGRVMGIASLLGVISVYAMVLTIEASIVITLIVAVVVSVMAATALSKRKIARFLWG